MRVWSYDFCPLRDTPLGTHVEFRGLPSLQRGTRTRTREGEASDRAFVWVRAWCRTSSPTICRFATALHTLHGGVSEEELEPDCGARLSAHGGSRAPWICFFYFRQ